jgi:hypothetical protein
MDVASVCIVLQGIEGSGQLLLATVYRDFAALYSLLPVWLTASARKRDLWTFQVRQGWSTPPSCHLVHARAGAGGRCPNGCCLFCAAVGAGRWWPAACCSTGAPVMDP